MEASQNEMHSRLDPSNNLPFLETPSLSGEPSEVGLQGQTQAKEDLVSKCSQVSTR